MGVSQLVTDRVGVLQHLYISTCIPRCVLYSCMHTHEHIQVHSYIQVIDGSDRVGVLQMPANVCTCLFTGVYCAVVCTHMTVHLFYRW